jgi:biuret amidohydrolase
MTRKRPIVENTALAVVDMQNYYLLRESSYYRYFNSLQPGCLDYIVDRCFKLVIPNIKKLTDYFEERGLPVIYLRLCGTREDRSDLHRFFMETYRNGLDKGFEDVYPLRGSAMAEIHEQVRPGKNAVIIDKTTYSPFTSTRIKSFLNQLNVDEIVFTGLATSQCVETSARDASDNGFSVIHIEDAQADYDELAHVSSLYSSKGVCGGMIISTEELITSADN